MLRRNTRTGASTLEVIASLVIFALAAAGLAVVLPMAFDRSEVWRSQMNLSRSLESHCENVRYTAFESLIPGSTGWVNEGALKYQILTNLAKTGTENGNPTWIPITAGSGDGIQGTYYDNPNYSGYSEIRIDPNINFNWGKNQPTPNIGRDTFSVRWVGNLLTLGAGNYTFYANTSDGVRLWINNQKIIDNWVIIKNKAQEVNGTITLNANTLYPIKMEYFESSKFATAELRWSGPGIVKQIIPQSQFFSNQVKMSVISVTDNIRTISGRVMTFSPQSSAPQIPIATQSFTIQMYNNDRTLTTNTLRPWISLINTDASPINLTDIKIRYYFTADGTQNQTYVCDWAGMSPMYGNIAGGVTGQLVKMTSPKPTADYYLEIGFTAAAGSLPPGQRLELQQRIYKSDWSNYNQNNDYSFNSTAANFVDWYNVTGYISGMLIWGTEP